MVYPLTESSLGQYSIMLCTCQHSFQYYVVHVKGIMQEPCTCACPHECFDAQLWPWSELLRT